MSNRSKARSILKGVRVTEVSLVDEGDNPGADVVVIKRRLTDPEVAFEAFAEAVAKLNVLAAGEEGAEGVAAAAKILKGLNMNIDELNEKLSQIEETVETVTKAKAEAEAENAKLKAALEEAEAEIKKLKADGAEQDEDEVLKSLPEPIRKRLLDAEAAAARAEEAIAKANEQREIEAAVAKAKGYGLGDPIKLGEALHRITKGRSTAEDATVIEEAFAKAQAVMKNSKLFDTIGSAHGGDANDPEQKLRTVALEIQKAKPALSYEAAYTEALEANPGLYDEVVKARRATAN